MKISINWLKEYVDLPQLSSEELAKAFTLATCEVEDVIETGELLKRVTIVEVLTVEKHPDAEKLNLVTFNTGDTGIKKVVCGAPNVRPGIRVPFAPVGCCMANGLILEPKKIRGILSEGMLCSEKELGISEEASGLMILPPNAPIGQTMADFMGISTDTLLDIDNKSITHRPDLWGHYGMAREFATVWNQPLKNPFSDSWMKNLEKHFTSDPSPVKPVVHKDSCGRAYYGLTVTNITVGQSPLWMQQRLTDCGMRPINTIVDISNYVMLELGLPNHIFDLETIENKEIIIRRAGSAQDFITLDSISRPLLPTDTVVCDAVKPLVIAGIMGGENSGVTENTQSIFIEVANWVDSEIRKTSARLGLRTDSSQRFEKCLDSRLCKRTMYRLLELVLQLCPNARVIGKIEWDGYEAETPYHPLVIAISSDYICRNLGKPVETEKMIDILTSLDFKVVRSGELLQVEVPSYRATKDIECKADIVEEIGRIIGYDNIEPVSPLWTVEPMRLRPPRLMQRKIRDFFVFHAGALEIFTNPMVGGKLLQKASWPQLNEKLVLLNALSTDHDRMRPSLVPSILDAVALNSKNYSDFALFEIGRSYLPHDENFSSERNQLAVVFYSRTNNRFVECVNSLENLMRFLKLPVKLLSLYDKNPYVQSNWPGLHPYETRDINVMGKSQGFITTLHPVLCQEFKVKGYVTLMILDLAEFENQESKDKTKFKQLPRFPHSTFDCTVVTGLQTPVADILTALEKLKMPELVSSKIVVVFQLDEERKTVTIRNTFSDESKTLSGDEIKAAEERVIKGLTAAGYPLKN